MRRLIIAVAVLAVSRAEESNCINGSVLQDNIYVQTEGEELLWRQGKECYCSGVNIIRNFCRVWVPHIIGQVKG